MSYKWNSKSFAVESYGQNKIASSQAGSDALVRIIVDRGMSGKMVKSGIMKISQSTRIAKTGTLRIILSKEFLIFLYIQNNMTTPRKVPADFVGDFRCCQRRIQTIPTANCRTANNVKIPIILLTANVLKTNKSYYVPSNST